VIHLYGSPDPPIPRLAAALAARGHRLVAEGGRSPGESSTLVLGAGAALDPMALGVLLGAWRKTPRARVLIVSALGAHPDARAPRLLQLWELEEAVRAMKIPSITLRLAPLAGPDSPFWRRLRSRPRLGSHAHGFVQPVAEVDVIDTLDHALAGRVAWEGWYELAGPDVFELGELIELAGSAGPPLPSGAGEWEPPLAEIAEHRVAETGPWTAHFGITPRTLAGEVTSWAG